MAEYTIKMADERGRVLEQIENGVSEAEIRDRFAQQGYYVYSIKSKGLFSGEIGLPRRRKVKQDQFVIFNQQFVTLIHAGLPIIQSLELLIKRQRNVFFRSVLQSVRDRVRGGELLSEAFEAQKVFPKVYTTTLLAGEKSGNLEEVLGRYIAFQRLSVSFRKKLISSLVYPALLVVVLIVMMTFLITFVVPQFANLYHTLGAALPPMTSIDALHRRQRQALFPLYPGGLGAGGIFPLALDEERARLDADGSHQAEDSVAGRHLVEVPGRGVLAHAVDAAVGRIAAGSVAGDRGRIDAEPPDGARHRVVDARRPRRPGTGEEPGRDARSSRRCRWR